MAAVEASIVSKFRHGKRNRVSAAGHLEQQDGGYKKFDEVSDVEEIEEGKFKDEKVATDVITERS